MLGEERRRIGSGTPSTAKAPSQQAKIRERVDDAAIVRNGCREGVTSHQQSGDSETGVCYDG